MLAQLLFMLFFVLTFSCFAFFFRESFFGSSKTEQQRLGDDELPEKIGALIRQSESQFRNLGYRFCFNELCRRRGTTSFSRYYISSDSKVIGCDCVYVGRYSNRIIAHPVAFKCILVDGTVVESSTCSGEMPGFLRNMNREAMLELQLLSTNDVLNGNREHLKFVSETKQKLNLETMNLSSEMISEITEYTLQLVDWQMYRKGVICKPPEPLSFGLGSDAEVENETTVAV